MKTLMISLASVAMLSCSVNKKEKETHESTNKPITEQQIDSVIETIGFGYQNPINIDQNKTLLIPLSTHMDRKKSSKLNVISSKGRSNNFQNPHYWNLLFYNKKTSKNHVLSEQKMNIEKFQVNLTQYGNILRNSNLYLIKTIDLNNDSLLDHKDPTYLYISDGDGHHLKPISPLLENVTKYDLIQGTNQIIIHTTQDSNNDSIFSLEEEHNVYYLDLNKKHLEKDTILNSVIKKPLERLFYESWVNK